MFLLLITVFFSSTLIALTLFKVKERLLRTKINNNNDIIAEKRIPGPTGYPFIGNGLEFIFPDSVG